MSPISDSSATAGARAITRCLISRLCSAVNGGKTRAATVLAVGAVPAKRVPDVLEALTNRYVAERASGTRLFQTWVKNLGRKEIKAMLQPYMKLPSFEEQPEYFSDWGDSRVYTIDDIGVGECAGEVVSLFSHGNRQSRIDALRSSCWRWTTAITIWPDQQAYKAMVAGGAGIGAHQISSMLATIDDNIVNEFRSRFYDTELIYDRFAKGKFARYLFKRHGQAPQGANEDYAHQMMDETQLFIENIHSAEQRINGVIPFHQPGGVS